MPTIEERYHDMFSGSRDWYQRGRSLFAGGVTHQTRFTSPFPLYIEHADGPYKYDVDGNRVIDYVMGNGSLLMGHNPPAVTAAVTEAATRGTHLGGATVHEVRYAEAVKRLIPSLDQVRFTSAGTESTLLAMRLARGYTGKSRIVKFFEHFHGWHDYGTPDSGQSTGGVPQAVLDTVIVAPVDIAAVDWILSEDDDIAGVIVEANGAHWGTVPLQNPQFLQNLQDVTRRHGVVFIMDEVVTGFRLSPGGAQVRWDLEPDITTLAKIVAGGLPGGAVCGRKDILDFLDFDVSKEAGREKVRHQGTFNANPVSAAAGVAALRIIKTGEPGARAAATAETLRAELNRVLAEEDVPWSIYGEFSMFHIFTNPNQLPVSPVEFDATACGYRTFAPDPRESLLAKMRLGMLIHGVDLKGWRGGFLSAEHDQRDLEQTVDAWRKTLRMLKDEGEIDGSAAGLTKG